MVLCASACLLSAGCGKKEQIDSSTAKSVKIQEEARLQDAPASPACRLAIDFGYIEADEADTVAQRINETVQAAVLGKAYIRTDPASAVEAFKDAYFANYRKEVGGFFEEDMANGTPLEELPKWYNYEYSLTGTFGDGKEGILNYTATTSEYTGGAHPNTRQRWLNFDKRTGRTVTASDAFAAGSEPAMCRLLLEALIKEISRRTGNGEIKTLADLQDEGILDTAPMYIPDDFLLREKEVSFLYNPYDIAPYAVGAIELSLPYSEIEEYMNDTCN